ncbi:MFS transporter [Paracraurococcus lichenis]|uniref:MFS transporter n=1 Tax=Paracraurococcus lichenis TaxID=3064888 RepID=A0ABT9E896_9PROT|nr:MFS transporter [Paracraurococcus sp. LOR1-02]MDO9712427.1 MFS transporter [Paracraurococcus sp. LOR1-02]
MAPWPAGGAGRYVLLYVALFLGWGVLSPFLPAVLEGQGASPEEIGLILGGGIAVRLVATPLVGAVADRRAAPRACLFACLLLAALAALGYGAAAGFGALLLVGLLQHGATGPVGPLPDALAVRAAAAPGLRLDYGLLRGIGSAAFVAGTALAGQAVAAAADLRVVLWLHAGCFLLAALATLALPVPPAAPAPRARRGAFRPLLALPAFRLVLLATALVSGSHAVATGYATIRWREAGIGAETIGLLWSVSVASEILVFAWIGPRLLARLGPGALIGLAAAAGVLRWSVMALTAAVPAMVLAQPLHGMTFAAQHLAAMAVIGRSVPPALAASAQALYATLGVGLAGAVATLASGLLYGRFGAGAFWAMALLCLAALPVAQAIRRANAETSRRLPV